MTTSTTDPTASSGPASVAPPGDRDAAERRLVGNRMVLAGVVLYLCEFAGIIPAGIAHLPTHPGTPVADVPGAYADSADGLGFLVGWYGLVMIGRVLWVIGVRRALRDSGHRAPWMDLATLAALVGVVMEIAMVALAAGAGALARIGQDTAVVALDRGAWYLESAVMAPTGMALLISFATMSHSRLFPRTLCILGLLVATAVIASGLLGAPSLFDLADALSTAVLLGWLLMLWTGILCWRRARD